MDEVDKSSDPSAAWQRALKHWEEQPSLSFPETTKNRQSIAYIDLIMRQVFVNYKMLDKSHLSHTLSAVLAHEIGHHVQYPHTLRNSAELEILGHDLVPTFHPAYLNIFYDLLINEHVGRDAEYRTQLIDLYRGLSGDTTSKVFRFYLSIYEALWDCRGSILLKEPSKVELDRADIFAQTFYALSNIYEQFVYFCGAFSEVFLEELYKNNRYMMSFEDIDTPSAEDYPSDMQPSPAARRAVEKGREAGWLPEGVGAEQVDPNAPAAGGDKAFERLRKLTSSVPGRQRKDFVEVLADRIYSRIIEDTIEKLPEPKIPQVADPYLPSILEESDDYADLGGIDWTASLIQRGELAPVYPLRREFIAEEEEGVFPGMPRLEIYLDTSGSMPNPLTNLNVMTVAAQVLSAFAIRKGAAVRGIIYSFGPFKKSGWMRSEASARKFFFNYSGGGTDFPFAECLSSIEKAPDAFRVVISDSDFVYNLRNQDPTGKKAFLDAVARSRRFILLLLGVSQMTLENASGSKLPSTLHLATVDNAGDLARIAALLARALFDK